MKEILLDKLLVSQEESIVDVMKKISDNTLDTIFVIDGSNRLIGALSDGDIRRWIISTGDLSAKVVDVMNKTPHYIHYSNENEARNMMSKAQIHLVPIVNDNMEIIDVASDEVIDVRSKKLGNIDNVAVVIMAGGKGTRLKPYTSVLPKPLIPINDVPIIQRIIDSFSVYGIMDYYLTINYKGGIIRAYFDDLKPRYKINMVDESVPLGTAGSIKLIDYKFERPFFVSNCDILIKCDYSILYDYHIKSGNALTAVAAIKNISIPYGVFETGNDGRILNIKEKPKRSYLVNTGMYILNPEVISLIPDNKVYHMTDFMEDLINAGEKVGIYPIGEGSFWDMGQFDEMKNMNEMLRYEQQGV